MAWRSPRERNAIRSQPTCKIFTDRESRLSLCRFLGLRKSPNRSRHDEDGVVSMTTRNPQVTKKIQHYCGAEIQSFGFRLQQYKLAIYLCMKRVLESRLLICTRDCCMFSTFQGCLNWTASRDKALRLRRGSSASDTCTNDASHIAELAALLTMHRALFVSPVWSYTLLYSPRRFTADAM